MVTFRAGDKVLVRSAPEDVKATILSLFGTGREQYARLVVELPGDDDLPELRSITLPVTLLHKAA